MNITNHFEESIFKNPDLLVFSAKLFKTLIEKKLTAPGSEYPGDQQCFYSYDQDTDKIVALLSVKEYTETIGWIYSAGVLPEYKRKGIYCSLFDYATSTISDYQWGWKTLSSGIYKNNIPMISAAKKQGRVMTGYHDKYPEEQIWEYDLKRSN